MSDNRVRMNPTCGLFSRVNCNVDLIVRGTSLLNRLKQLPSEGTDHEIVHSLSELEEAFSHSFARGAGVERAFSSKEEYAATIEAASQLENAQVFCHS